VYFGGTPDTIYRVEFFSDPKADPTFYGQGQTFLGFKNVTTDSNGVASFTDDVATAVPSGQFISATATDPAGNTSEFSADQVVVYTPAQIRNAYGINAISFSGGQTPDGTGQTIAIVDAYNDPNICNDVDAFDLEFGTQSTGPTLFDNDKYGASSNFLTVVDQTGAVIDPSSTSVPTDPTGLAELEETTDVEWAHAVAPGAKIILIECKSLSSSDLYTGVAAADDLATGTKSISDVPRVSVVSMSWGGLEGTTYNQSDEQYYDQNDFRSPGVTYLAGAGDDGYPGDYPAFSPDVVAVGGTSLQDPGLTHHFFLGFLGFSWKI